LSSTFGKNIKISVSGQSHSAALGVIVDGFPAGFEIDTEQLYAFMQRRAPGRNKFSTPRSEADRPEILSGTVGSTTCGAPLMAIIRNTNTRSSDYDNLRDVPRPSHADFTANEKYGGFQDASGGGHFSGRITAAICIAGGIALQMLRKQGIEVFAHIKKIHSVSGEAPDYYSAESLEKLRAVAAKAFPVYDDGAGELMMAEIERARESLDSVGGGIECAVTGLPVGVGDPMFDGIESKLSAAIFAVPAVKGVEFGSGFACADMLGSEHNDPFYMDENGDIKTKTNNHGGILGGISSGMPIVFRTAIKPTPSIAKAQESVSLSRRENAPLEIKGRHDPCIVQRAVPVIEAAAALVILDLLADFGKSKM